MKRDDLVYIGDARDAARTAIRIAKDVDPNASISHLTIMNISIPKDKIAEFCERNQIVKLSFFGSVLRDDFGPDSDIDVLVEFDPKAKITFFGLYSMEMELSELLGYDDVDMRSPEDISRYIRDDVVKGAELIYAR